MNNPDTNEQKSGGDQGHGGGHEVNVIVNGRKKPVAQKELSFDDVVTLAFGPPNYDSSVFTVTYQKGPDSHPKGTMVRGQSVKVKDGMIFDVIRTDKS